MLDTGLDMLFRGSTEAELHYLIVFEFRFTDQLELAFGLGEDCEMGFEGVAGGLCGQLFEVFYYCFRVFTELDVKFLYFLNAPKIHIITPKLKIKLQLTITSKLNTNKPQILRAALYRNLNQQLFLARQFLDMARLIANENMHLMPTFVDQWARFYCEGVVGIFGVGVIEGGIVVHLRLSYNYRIN